MASQQLIVPSVAAFATVTAYRAYGVQNWAASTEINLTAWLVGVLTAAATNYAVYGVGFGLYEMLLYGLDGSFGVAAFHLYWRSIYGS